MDSFFSLSKLFWFLAAPEHILVWLLLLGFVALLFNKRSLAVKLIAVDLLLWLLLLLMPLGDMVMRPLEDGFTFPNLDCSKLKKMERVRVWTFIKNLHLFFALSKAR